jgi:hypothetical protein
VAETGGCLVSDRGSTDGAAKDIEHFFAGVRIQRLFVPGLGRYFYQTAARVSGDEKIS